MRKVLFLSIIILFFPLSHLFSQPSQPSQSSIDRATREVDKPYREEAEKKLEPLYRKKPIIEYRRIDLADTPDGIYKGTSSDFGDAVIKVEVTVKNSQVIDIKVVTSRDDSYVEMAKEIIGNIITEQSLRVDAVTGATRTSNAICDAVRNALERKGEL